MKDKQRITRKPTAVRKSRARSHPNPSSAVLLDASCRERECICVGVPIGTNDGVERQVMQAVQSKCNGPTWKCRSLILRKHPTLPIMYLLGFQFAALPRLVVSSSTGDVLGDLAFSFQHMWYKTVVHASLRCLRCTSTSCTILQGWCSSRCCVPHL